MMSQIEYKLQFDGCSKNNPGLAGAGAVIYKNGIEIWSNHLFVGTNNTNNYAEYMGLIFGLEKAIELNIDKRNNEFYVNRGSAKMEINDYTGAIQDFNAAIEINPGNVIAFCKRGIAKIKLEN